MRFLVLVLMLAFTGSAYAAKIGVKLKPQLLDLVFKPLEEKLSEHYRIMTELGKAPKKRHNPEITKEDKLEVKE